MNASAPNRPAPRTDTAPPLEAGADDHSRAVAERFERRLAGVSAEVAALQRANRKLRRVMIGALVVAGCVAAMGAAPASKIVGSLGANAFELNDASGNLRARMALAADGDVAITLLRDGRAVRELRLVDRAPYLVAAEATAATSSAPSPAPPSARQHPAGSTGSAVEPAKVEREEDDRDSMDWTDH